MAEALAIVGLASAIVQFVDFGTKVVRQLRHLEEDIVESTPHLKNLRTRLPLMLDLVKKIMLQVEAGLVSDDSKELMYPLIQNSLAHAQELDVLMAKSTPQAKDKAWIRGKKAVYGVLFESEIGRIDAPLKSNFELLMQAGTFHTTNRQDRKNTTSFNPTFTLSPNIQIQLPGLDSKIPPPYSLESEKAAQTQKRVFMIPFPRDSNFLGRHDVLQQVDEAFRKGQMAALSGLGGIGKSQIAIEYCYIFRKIHPEAHIFWIYGADPSHFEQGYQKIGRKAEIPGCEDLKTDNLKLVQEWLESEKTTDWLMIIDKADDASILYGKRSGGLDIGQTAGDSKAFAQYLPRCAHGRILITTRDRRLGHKLTQRQGTVPISSLDLETSTNLLRSKISEENWSEEDALKLVDYLSFLPLAITQAAAFMSENYVSVPEYLEMLINDENEMKELLSEHLEDARRDLNSENSVMRTWKLSFEQILKESPRAADALSLIAVLDFHGVLRSLLCKDRESEPSFRVALGVLQAFSLITATRDRDPICKMHPLVAAATQKWLDVHGTLQYWQAEALNILVAQFPGPGQQTFREFPLMLSLVPHTDVVFRYEFSSNTDKLSCAKLWIAGALFDLSSARYHQALAKCERSLSIRESILPSDHPETVESLQTLGETQLHLGELSVAKDLLERAIEGRRSSLGDLHADTLESFSDLTITHLELNDLDSAETTGLKALEGRRKVLGTEHSNYLVSLNIIAILHQLKGDFEEALKMTETVLKAREKKLGYGSPDTLMTLNNLARLKQEMGDLKTAETMINKVIAGEEAMLAGYGYDIQVSLTNKASILVTQGRLDEAAKTLQRVLEMRQRSLGVEHPSTQFTIETLIGILDMRRGEPANIDDAILRQKLKGPPSDKSRWADSVSTLLAAGLWFD